jgi:hypothetical protein
VSNVDRPTPRRNTRCCGTECRPPTIVVVDGYSVALVPTGDGGVAVGDARADGATVCTVDDRTDDCTSRGLHRYVCPAGEPIELAGCSPTGELSGDGIVTRCCP